MYMNCEDINYVYRKYHISRVSLWRGMKKYDGTKDSLIDKSHKPKTRHPNSHTNQEIRWIRNIDEATRERFLYWYEEHTPLNTIDFVKRVINHFGYIPKEIQTDNGIEFTYNRADIKKEHPLEVFFKKLGIKHHKIRPHTPEHNGKVERSH